MKNLQTILNENAEMVNDMKDGGSNWINSPLFTALMDYFADEMPYGVQTGDEGLPEDWIAERVS